MDDLKFFAGLSAITMTGTALWACVVGFWVVCAVARELRPETWFGQFLRTMDGVVSIFVGSVFVAVTAGVILERLSYPPYKNSDES